MFLVFRRVFFCAFAILWPSIICQAQDASSLLEGALPPVTVRPPTPSTTDSTLLPEETSPSSQQSNSPPTTPRRQNTNSIGTTLNFPNLANLQFGQSSGPFGENSGILRSEKSIFDSSAAGSIRTRQEIAERQAPDMFQALQNEVGVLMQSTAAGQASPFVRGLTGQQVLILVDGIRLNNSITRRGPNQYFNTIDPGMVDHIEVLRGQGSVLWGSDAIGGAINVVTRGADARYGMRHGDYSGGEFVQYYNTANSSPYSRMNVEGWVGNAGVFAGGSFANVRDLDTGWDFGRQPGTNYQQWAGDIKFNYLLDDNQMLTFSLQHFQQDNLPRSDRFPGFPGDLNSSNSLGGARFFDPQQRDLAYVRYQALAPTAAIDALTVTASYNRQREIQTRGVPTTRFQETDVDTFGVQAVAVKDLDWLGKWSSGFDWYYDNVDSPFGGTASGPIVPDDAWYQRVGTFLNWDVALTERLDMVAGVRYENINTAGTPVVEGIPTFINPSFHDWVSQIGFVYEVDPGVHLVGSISEGFRAPNLDDLMALNPNVLQEGSSVPSLGLRPERSINYELGVKTNFDRLRTQTFVFWTDLQNNIVSIDTAVANTFASANQDSYVQGVETSGEYVLDGGWSLYGNFWYTYGINRVTNSPLSRVPPTQGILGFRWRERRLRSYFEAYTWMVRRQDRLDQVRDITDERIPIGGTPGYATLNMRAGRTFGDYDQHRLSLSIENITDKNYLVHGSGVFGTGATARVGYSLKY
ncbi:MAG: TonB-dependent receptor [Planctomycetes bacterium]|nr:TonB-dependent receptor [Planctomycetota bacterium]